MQCSERSHSQFMTIEIRDNVGIVRACIQHKSLRRSTDRALTYDAEGPGFRFPVKHLFFSSSLLFSSPFSSSFFLSLPHFNNAPTLS